MPVLPLARLQPSIVDAANDSAGRVQMQQESLLPEQVLSSFTQIKCETANVTAAFPPLTFPVANLAYPQK